MATSVSWLDFNLEFDLVNNRVRVNDTTDYTSQGITESTVLGVLVGQDPNGNYLWNNANYSEADIDLSKGSGSASSSEDNWGDYSDYVNLPLSSGSVVEGEYSITYTIQVDGGSEYTKTKTFTYDSSDIPSVVINITTNIAQNTFESVDSTSYGATVTLNERNHVVEQPGSFGIITSSDATVSLTQLYTNTYTVTVTSDITITNTDDLVIDTEITGSETADVWAADAMASFVDELSTLY